MNVSANVVMFQQKWWITNLVIVIQAKAQFANWLLGVSIIFYPFEPLPHCEHYSLPLSKDISQGGIFNSNKAILIVNRCRFLPTPKKLFEIIKKEMKCALQNWINCQLTSQSFLCCFPRGKMKTYIKEKREKTP